MACFQPVKAYYAKSKNANGKRSLVFDKRLSWSGVTISIPCGRCIGCRLNRSRLWAIRCVHEMKMHSQSAFVTLTYGNAHLPKGSTLVKRDVQLFMKRLRKQRPTGLRFFACGEYGDQTRRPHYHILLFNTDFEDKRYWKDSNAGFPMWKSSELDEIWGLGDCYIGSVSFDSAAYVARYSLKKRHGKDAVAYYGGREPEFLLMSRRPGIGFAWFQKYYTEAYAHDSAIMNAREVGLPRYYDTKYESVNPVHMEELKLARRRAAMLRRDDNTKERLHVREEFETRKAQRFLRDG